MAKNINSISLLFIFIKVGAEESEETYVQIQNCSLAQDTFISVVKPLMMTKWSPDVGMMTVNGTELIIFPTNLHLKIIRSFQG